MADVNDVLAANRAAVLDLVAAARAGEMVAEPGRGACGAFLGRIGQTLFWWGSVDPDAPRFPAPAAQTGVLQPDLEEGRISEGV